MSWEAEGTEEFATWFETLGDSDSRKVISAVDAMLVNGPMTGRPLVDTLNDSDHPNMKELRTDTIRVFFAFDPTQTSILLIGGDKAGDKSFYKTMIPMADKIYSAHLKSLEH